MSAATLLPVAQDSSWPHLRAVIEDGIANHPRTLQTALGPSDLATACDRCLVHLLAGHKPTEHVVPWLPTVGTAIHAWLDERFRFLAWSTPDGDRWHIEERVHVGQVAGTDIYGSCDLFDEATGTVTDWKLVGKTTLDKVRRSGASLTYQGQGHTYGRGWELLGHTVNRVQIIFLPRNAVSLQYAQVWTAPYSRAAADLVLQRANALHAGITTLGVDAVLAMTPPHTGEEFSCGKFPGDTPTSPVTAPAAAATPLTGIAL